jgi:hypothetical protein
VADHPRAFVIVMALLTVVFGLDYELHPAVLTPSNLIEPLGGLRSSVLAENNTSPFSSRP